MTTEQAIVMIEKLENQLIFQEQITIYIMFFARLIGILIAFYVVRMLYKYYFVSLFKWVMNKISF
jgi:hypothetical protein